MRHAIGKTVMVRVFLIVLPAVLLFAGGCQSTSAPPLTEKGAEPGRSPRERGLLEISDHRVRRLKQSGLLAGDEKLRQYIERVGKNVVSDEAQEKLSFDFYVLEHPVPNAFALPNGAIFVHSGLIARLENEAQLALILAHEGEHVVKRHSIEQMASVQNKLGALRWVQVLVAPAGDIGQLTSVIGQLYTIAAVYGFSRDLEREADRAGFRAMVEAGYNPYEAPEMFRLLNLQLDRERDPPPYLYATHPRNRERRRYLSELADEVPEGDYVKRTGPFRDRTRSLRLSNATKNINRYWPRTARYELDLVLDRNPDHGRALFLKAKTYFYIDKRNLNRAVELSEKAIENGYDRAEVDLFLGRVYLEKNQPERARKHLKRTLRKNPQTPRRKMIRRMIKEAGGTGEKR